MHVERKYEQWKAITESDFVTLFIKTWFTFIAILRELNPDVKVFTKDGMPRGDKPFLNAYKEGIMPFVQKNIDTDDFAQELFAMYSISMRRANYLLQEAEHARKENSYYEYTNKMATYDLLVVDDFGLMDLDMTRCRDLLEVIESRDCRKATIIISQVPVAKWYTMFGNNTYADACLSRMTSKAYRLEFPGRDRRLDGNN